MKQPKQCKNIKEIRTEIDKIDKEIINLISKRSLYVKEAAKFKTSKTSVKAPERVKAMLEKRCLWAKKKKLNPNFIKTFFKNLVNYFIKEEIKKWKTP